MANKQRGEVTITLMGKTYVLRPTFEAMCEIEDRLDTAMPDLLIRFQNGDVRYKHIATIIWAGMWAYDKDSAPSYEEVGEMIRSHGLTKVLTMGRDNPTEENPIVAFMSRGILGDKTVEEVAEQNKKGNDKVETEKKTQ
jgi:hypothetical protein